MAPVALCRRYKISVVELQWVSEGNSDSGSEWLRLPKASITIVFSGSIIIWTGYLSKLFVGTKLPQTTTLVQK